MWSMRSRTSSRSSTERCRGRRTRETVAVRQPPRGASGRPAPRPSVTMVPLLPPGVAEVVVAVLLPEPGLVARHQGELADPLRALPEVEVRDQQPDGTTVLDGQRLPVELPDHPRLAAGDVLERQVGRVAGLRRRHDEVRLGGPPGGLQEGVDADPREVGVELRPGRDAVDVTAVLRRRQPVRLVPRPGGRVLDHAVDGDAPRLRGDPRRGLGRQHRPVAADVVLTGGQPRVARTAAEKSSGGTGHVGHSPTAVVWRAITPAALSTAATVSITSSSPVRHELTENRITVRPCQMLAEGITVPSASSRRNTSRVRSSDPKATVTCV